MTAPDQNVAGAGTEVGRPDQDGRDLGSGRDEQRCSDEPTEAPATPPVTAPDLRAAPVVTLTIDARGHPAPKGSKDFKGMRGGKPILVEHSPLLPAWTTSVVLAARSRVAVTGWVMLTGACEVEIIAWFPRPKTVTRAYPSTRAVGDSDKIARSCLDAITTAGVIADDALVTDLTIRERYTTQGAIGARITVTPLLDTLKHGPKEPA